MVHQDPLIQTQRSCYFIIGIGIMILCLFCDMKYYADVIVCESDYTTILLSLICLLVINTITEIDQGSKEIRQWPIIDVYPQ